jgi:cytochrome c oxidase subunit 4
MLTTMNDKKAAAYRLGVISLVILAVLTIVEYFIAVYMGSLVLLFIIALVKAAVIVQNFMHIARLWREESH